jgi:hypothetical protein
MRRILIGILALLFLGAAGAIYLRGVTDENMFFLSVCQRVGLVLGAMWLSYEQVLKISQRSPPWLLGCIGFALLVIVIRPKAILIVAPLLALVALLQFFGWLFKPLPNPPKATRATRPPKDGPA